MTVKSIFICFILFVASIPGLQCKSSHDLAAKRKMLKEIYLNQFKLTYFRQLLIKSYNNSNSIKEIIYSDHSGFTEPIILTESDNKLIDSFTTSDNEKLKADSIEGYRRAEGSDGKRPLGYILYKINSKWLDSLARHRLKLSGGPKRWME